MSNEEFIEPLSRLPDEVADALYAWRKAKAEREKIMGITFLNYRGDSEKRTVSEIDALVDSNDGCYKAKLYEAVAEAQYTRLIEKLYAIKRAASLRAAF